MWLSNYYCLFSKLTSINAWNRPIWCPYYHQPYITRSSLPQRFRDRIYSVHPHLPSLSCRDNRMICQSGPWALSELWVEKNGELSGTVKIDGKSDIKHRKIWVRNANTMTWPWQQQSSPKGQSAQQTLRDWIFNWIWHRTLIRIWDLRPIV